MDLNEKIILLEKKLPNNNFAMSLVNNFKGKGSLSEKQIFWVNKLLQEQEKADLDISKITKIFTFAHNDSGLRQPSYRVPFNNSTLKLSLVTMKTSVNHGSIYVKLLNSFGEWDWLGKITKNVFYPSQLASDFSGLQTKLESIASDPLGQATDYGKLTGNCFSCGRTLTDPDSVKNGMGAICKANFGL